MNEWNKWTNLEWMDEWFNKYWMDKWMNGINKQI